MLSSKKATSSYPKHAALPLLLTWDFLFLGGAFYHQLQFLLEYYLTDWDVHVNFPPYVFQ